MDRGRDELRQRTKYLALDIIRLTQELPDTAEFRVIALETLRAGTAVGARYRKACRAKSDERFIGDIEDTLQELEQTSYWLEILVELGIVEEERVRTLTQETTELTAIFITIVRKVKNHNS